MKHLRRFNEGLKDELQDFCETNLAYLIDEGFRVRISKFDGDDFHQIIIATPNNSLSNSLWLEMKDHIIPFFHFLFKDYELYHDNGSEPAMGFLTYKPGPTNNLRTIKQTELTLDQINDLPDDTEFYSFFIRVVKKEDKKIKKAWFSK